MGWVGEGGGEREKGGYRGKYLMFIQHKYSKEYSTVAKKKINTKGGMRRVMRWMINGGMLGRLHNSVSEPFQDITRESSEGCGQRKAPQQAAAENEPFLLALKKRMAKKEDNCQLTFTYSSLSSMSFTFCLQDEVIGSISLIISGQILWQ